MNVVLDVGNAEYFLKKQPLSLQTFMENEEETFEETERLIEYLRSKQEYQPKVNEDKAMYKTVVNGNKFVVNGVSNPIVNEIPTDGKKHDKFCVFYFQSKADNMNYLLNELI